VNILLGSLPKCLAGTPRPGQLASRLRRGCTIQNTTIGRPVLGPMASVGSDDDANPYALPRFQYEPLGSPAFSIRLLKVYSDEETGPVRVRLWECRASGTDQYRCLSYMWGAPSGDIFGIPLNDCVLRVLENLYRFLRTASQRFPNTPLWIDAMSISQKDDAEKAETFELTLITPFQIQRPGLTKQLDSVALQHNTNCEWQGVKSRIH
jgi:hypothetical protein